MPTTETPPSAPNAPGTHAPNEPGPAPSRSSRRGRLDIDELRGLETFDLLHVIEDIEDDRSRALLREKIWLALILHMVVFWYLIYGPKYIQHIRVVDPSTVLKQREKDMTMLDLPKDALKQLQPRQPKSTQPAPQTHVDRKMLDQLRAARRPVPPAPAPQQQTPPPPQVVQAPPPPPIERPAQPLPQTPSAAVEAPKPAPTQPNFNTGPTTAGDARRQAARQAAQGGAYSGGEMGSAPSPRGGNIGGGAEILSDTLGVDFGPYMQRIIYDTKRAWYPIIPEDAQPPLNKQGKVLIRFKILPDGSVKEMKLEGPSGDVSLDRAAWGGILGASPYPQLPKNFKGPFLELRFYFLYNIREGSNLR